MIEHQLVAPSTQGVSKKLLPPKFHLQSLVAFREHRAKPRRAGRPRAPRGQATAQARRRAPLEPDGGAQRPLQGQLDSPRRQGDDEVKHATVQVKM